MKLLYEATCIIIECIATLGCLRLVLTFFCVSASLLKVSISSMEHAFETFVSGNAFAKTVVD